LVAAPLDEEVGEVLGAQDEEALLDEEEAVETQQLQEDVEARKLAALVEEAEAHTLAHLVDEEARKQVHLEEVVE